MSAANFRSMNIAVSILLKRAIILPENKTGEDNSLVSPRLSLQTANVLLGVRRVAHNQQPVSRPHLLERFNHEVRIVLRLESRDIQNIAIRFNSPLADGFSIRTGLALASVSDHR